MSTDPTDSTSADDAPDGDTGRSAAGTDSQAGTATSFAARWERFAATPRNVVIAGAVAVAFVAVAAFAMLYVSSYSSIKTEGISRENALEARYQNNQNLLSSYVITIKEQLQIADRKTDRLDAVLTAAVEGRYDNELTATTPGEAPQLISALTEAYPDLSGLDTYDQLLTTIAAGRAGFANAQTVLLDEIAAYETFLNRGIWHAWMVRRVGLPTDGLEARIGDEVVRGPAALEQMKRIVTDSSTSEDFRVGETEPLDLNPDEPGEN
jgi:hypothetical protein